MPDSEMPADFARRVAHSVDVVLGESEAGRAALAICSAHQQSRRMIQSDRGGTQTVIAIVGPTGQGKSWLVRQFILDSEARERIVSGNNRDQVTERLTWVGPQAPVDLEPDLERYVQVPASAMADLSLAYLLLDAPGATDDRGRIAGISKRALSLASVFLLVVRRDQMRSETMAELAGASEGSIVIPIINQIRQRDDSLHRDVDSYVGRVRQVAPASRVVAPVLIDDFDCGNSDAQQVGADAIAEISRRLGDEYSGISNPDELREQRLLALDRRFRRDLQETLSDRLPRLTAAVSRIRAEADRLPIEVAESLVGQSTPLQAAVRSRLRLALTTETSAAWFPYRSVLSILNLTHGAWDRVLLSLSGSLPSLISAVYSSGRNILTQRGVTTELREGLRQRGEAAVAERIAPLTRQFRDEIRALREDDAAQKRSPVQDEDSIASLAGLDSLQQASAEIFEATIRRIGPTRGFCLFSGLIGTLLFWGLMISPLIGLYREYLSASYEVIRTVGDADASTPLDRFPQQSFSFWLTPLLLSLFPTAGFAMLVLSWVQKRSRVADAEASIRQQHHETIKRFQRDGVLKLQWNDPLLAEAEFLLSAGESHRSN
ncbi:MAG: hypothetical protein AAF958_14040 [Planctomycetota bacterium]